ncbi:hypothetical protein [Pseudidiomarina homiensis]|uniref:Uncharacterized protein n=1 Tax=Pseudidiomarina homiensis TaxID=364198 RepID=A0A432XXQ0_9GAMM|nr:hypothetical protein [Pseudidiomarina homiensis]RUO53467.1 hypothetical protein CWI70_09795 [Pseudidiomarina homiensis]
MKFLSLLAFVLTLTATTTNASEPYVVQVNAHDYRFEMPSQMKSGWVTFDFHNKGNEMHVAILGKRPDDVDLATFKEAIKNLTEIPFESHGGPGLHSPGHASKTTINLPPGDYVLLCGTRNASGQSHFRLGMVHYFVVTDEPNNAPEPNADMTMTLSMYDVATDAPLKPGVNTIRIENQTGYYGDAHLVSLNGDASLATARQYLESLKEPAPPHFIGGIEQGNPEIIQYLTVDLEAGKYGWISHEAAGYGINETFEVTTQSESEGIAFDEIENEMILEFSETGLDGPESIPAGRVQVINNTLDERMHAVAIFRLHEGKRATEARDFLVGQITNFEQGKLNMNEGLDRPFHDYQLFLPIHNPDNEVSVTLTPGEYALMCVGKLGTDEAHHQHGGLHTFTVTE